MCDLCFNVAALLHFQPLQQLVPLPGGEGLQEDHHGHVHAGLRVAAQGIPGPRFEVAAADRLQATCSGWPSFKFVPRFGRSSAKGNNSSTVVEHTL